MKPTLGDGRVSVIIKALNEERRIATAIESALAAVAETGGEVILADSCSTDRTIEIARGYPITIVQLENPAERCCGIGPQLGFQYASGEFVYILDGDMRLNTGFLPEAVAALRAHPEWGGVGGQVIERNVSSLEYQARVERGAAHMRTGEVDRLDMGGLYRRAAVLDAGYLSDRNLHSYEEVDLAARLRSKGWRLARLPGAAVDHHGHDTPPYALLVRRWSSRYMLGIGEVVRAGFGKPHLKVLLADLRELRLYTAVLALWLATAVVLSLGLTWPWRLGGALLLLSLPLVVLGVKKRSLAKVCYGYCAWAAHALALLKGLAAKRIDPMSAIAATVVQQGKPVVPAR